MARRQRIDSAAGAVATMAAAARDLSPPKHIKLRRGDLPFWDAVIAERAKSEWTDADLAVAANLARAMHDAEKIAAMPIGILPVMGPVFPRANIMTEYSGATSLDVAAADLRALQASPDVRSILMAVDSPGGAVAQVNEFARLTAKTLCALVPITNQLIRRASWGVDTMVRDDLVTSAAIKEDQQFLRGVGSSLTPSGLLSLIPAANKLTMTANPTLVTVRSDMARLKLRVVNANVPLSKCAYIMSPTVQSFLENITDGILP